MKRSKYRKIAYLCKSHENVNFKLKLIKRLKKLIIKIPVSVLLLLIKKRMKYVMEERKLNGKYSSHWMINTSSGLRFDLKTLDASCDISLSVLTNN